MIPPKLQVAIIGAGPYGLAAAAHLRHAGMETVIFGKPMEFWQQQMPQGMMLRSSWEASHIAAPDQSLTLDAYSQEQARQLPTPIPLQDFISYGQWFQRHVAPDLDSRRVKKVEPGGNGFRLELEDGDSCQVQKVVIACGIAPFAHRPRQFEGAPPALVSHTEEHADLGVFARKKMVVLGGGQSAIESAVLLHEAGADVVVILREPRLRWLRRSGWLHNQPAPLRALLYPPTDVGPPGLNQIVARPDLFRRFPLRWQQWIAYRCIRPAAAGWLFPRATGIQISTGRNILAALPEGNQLCLSLDDGTTLHADHLLLATGYQVDVARYPFLGADLVRSLRLEDGYPKLGAGFESVTVPGLHFLGAPAALSFGPVMRFVSGTGYAAPALARTLVAKRARRRG
jgi:FAD-dependent urate hydroxylase